jgi:hypothetical protein
MQCHVSASDLGSLQEKGEFVQTPFQCKSCDEEILQVSKKARVYNMASGGGFSRLQTSSKPQSHAETVQSFQDKKQLLLNNPHAFIPIAKGAWAVKAIRHGSVVEPSVAPGHVPSTLHFQVGSNQLVCSVHQDYQDCFCQGALLGVLQAECEESSEEEFLEVIRQEHIPLSEEETGENVISIDSQKGGCPDLNCLS